MKQVKVKRHTYEWRQIEGDGYIVLMFTCTPRKTNTEKSYQHGADAVSSDLAGPRQDISRLLLGGGSQLNEEHHPLFHTPVQKTDHGNLARPTVRKGVFVSALSLSTLKAGVAISSPSSSSCCGLPPLSAAATLGGGRGGTKVWIKFEHNKDLWAQQVHSIAYCLW